MRSAWGSVGASFTARRPVRIAGGGPTSIAGGGPTSIAGGTRARIPPGRKARVASILAGLIALALAMPALAAAASSTTPAHTTATTTVAPPASSLVPQPLGSGGLSGGLPATSTPSVTPTTSAPLIIPTGTTSSSGGGLGGGGVILIGLGAIGVLGGVVWFIWRDARHHAPVKPGGYTAAEAMGAARSGSKAPPKSRKLSPAERRRRKRGRAR